MEKNHLKRFGKRLFISLYAILWMTLTMMVVVGCHSQQSAAGAQSDMNSPTLSQVRKVEAMDNAAWNAAKWISAANAPVVTGKIDDNKNGRAADGASWFVTTVRNTKKVVSATWMTTALGVYELYVNGTPVGKEVLKPGFTNVLKTKRSFTYDITPLFRLRKKAENLLAVQVTPGWWADKIVTPYGNEGMMGKKCAFRGVLRLTYADGSTELLGSDLDHWKAGIAGPVQHAGIFDGEEYDARKPLGFLTTDLLSPPEENTEFKGEILPSDGAEVYFRDDLALRPAKAYVWRDINGVGNDEYGRVVVAREFAPNEEMVVGRGAMALYEDKLVCAGMEMPLEEITDMSVTRTRLLMLSFRNKYYEICAGKNANVRKYYEIWAQKHGL